MAEPSGNRGIEYLFSDDGKCSRYVAGFWGDLSDVKDIHGQPLCVGNMVTMLHSGEPYEQMIILKGKIPALTGAPEPSWCGFPAPIYRGGHHDRPMKQRTVLNVRRKRRRALYTALADAEALAPVKELYEAGLSGMETEFAQYMDAVAALEQCGVPREGLIQEKAELYDRLAELNRQIRAERRKLALCRKTQNSLPRMEQEIDKAEARESEVRTNEHRRR